MDLSDAAAMGATAVAIAAVATAAAAAGSVVVVAVVAAAVLVDSVLAVAINVIAAVVVLAVAVFMVVILRVVIFSLIVFVFVVDFLFSCVIHLGERCMYCSLGHGRLKHWITVFGVGQGFCSFFFPCVPRCLFSLNRRIIYSSLNV